MDSPVTTAIETRRLNLWYGTFHALFDVDLKVKQGIITSLIGVPVFISIIMTTRRERLQ